MTRSAPTCEGLRIETTFGITEPALEREVVRKLAAVRGLLAAQGLPAAVLRGTDCVAWVTGGLTNRIESGSPASAAWVVVMPDSADIVTTNVELPRLAADRGLEGFELHGVDWFERNGFARRAEELSGAHASRIGGLGVDIDDELIELRLGLDPDEQKRLTALAVDATVALEGAVREWSPGELDTEVQARVASGLERIGAFGACLIVGGDDRVEQFRHPLAAAQPVRQLLMAVIVAERRGLHVAATRFASAGALSATVREAHRLAAAVERTVLDASQLPATYGEALLALADAYVAVGRPGEWRDHYQGGPIGYRQREFEIVPTQTESRWFVTSIAPGSALAWNPSVAGGGKCEDTYLVGEGGLRRLTDSGDWPLEDGRPAVLDVVSGEAA